MVVQVMLLPSKRGSNTSKSGGIALLSMAKWGEVKRARFSSRRGRMANPIANSLTTRQRAGCASNEVAPLPHAFQASQRETREKPVAVYPSVGLVVVAVAVENVECCFEAMYDRLETALDVFHGYGHYHETYRRIDGNWLFASLTLTRLKGVWKRRDLIAGAAGVLPSS